MLVMPVTFEYRKGYITGSSPIGREVNNGVSERRRILRRIKNCRAYKSVRQLFVLV